MNQSNEDIRTHSTVNTKVSPQTADHVLLKGNTNKSKSKHATKRKDVNYSAVVKYSKDKQEYDLTKNLPIDSQLVKDQTANIEQRLKLKRLSKDLSSLSKFVRLACCGVVGHTELQIKTRTLLKNVGDITDDTFHTLQNFENTAQNALETMQSAYLFLKENLEHEAIEMLKKIQKNSETMCKVSNSLSDKCKKQSTEVSKVGNETLKEKVSIEAKKEETDRIAGHEKTRKSFQERNMTNLAEKVDEKKKEFATTLDNVNKELENKTKLVVETQRKLQEKNENLKKNKERLKLKYEADETSSLIEISRSQENFETALLSNKEHYSQALVDIDETFKANIKSAECAFEEKMKQNEDDYQDIRKKSEKLQEQKIAENKDNYEKRLSKAQTEYKFIIEKINKEYEDAIQTSNDELNNTLRLAEQKLEAALEANKRIYTSKVKTLIDKGTAEVHEEWSKKDAEEKMTKGKVENSAKADNIRKHKVAQENRDKNMNKAYRDKQNIIMKAEEDMNQAVLSYEESYQQSLEEFDRTIKENMKFAKDTYDEQKKEIEEEFQKVKIENEKVLEQSVKEQKEHYDKQISNLETEYEFTTKKITKQYQDTIQASNDQLEKILQIAEQKMETALKTNKQIYSAKIESWRKKRKAEIEEAWSKSNADERRVKSDSETLAKSDYNRKHKKAQETRDKELHEALEHKQNQLAQVEKSNKENLLSDKELLNNSLEEHEAIFKKRMKNAEHMMYVGQRNLNEEYQKLVREANKFYTQVVKEQQDKHVKALSETETEHQFTIEMIEKEYKDTMKASDDKLENMLTLDQQKLEAKLEAYQKICNGKRKACWTSSGQYKVMQEWRKSNAKEKEFSDRSEKMAKADNLASHNKAKETRDDMLKAVSEDKQKKLKNAETTLIKNLLSIKGSYEQMLKELNKQYKNKRFVEIKQNEEFQEVLIESKLCQTSNVQIPEECDHKNKHDTMVFSVDRTEEQISEQQTDLYVTQSSISELENMLAFFIPNFEVESKANTTSNAEVKAYEDERKVDINEKKGNVAETEYEVITKKIEKEYQDIIEANENKLNNILKRILQNFEVGLKATDEMFTLKVKACWTSTGQSKVYEEWAKIIADDKCKRSEEEYDARAENIETQIKVQNTRDRNLKQAFFDNQSKLAEVETDNYHSLLSIEQFYKQSLQKLDGVIKKIKLAKGTYDEQSLQNERELQTSKQKSDQLYEQNVKKHKEEHDKIVTDVEREYQITIKKITKEYEDTIQDINDELKNTLTSAEENLKTAIEANEQTYIAKIKAEVDKGKANISEEWSKEDAEEEKIKSENENSAKANNIRAHKIAQENRDKNLNKTYEDKQSKATQAKIDMNQNILSNKETHKQKHEDLYKMFERRMKSVEDEYQIKIKQNEEMQLAKRNKKEFYEQAIRKQKENYNKTVSDADNEYQFSKQKIDKEYQDAVQAINNELESTLILIAQKLEAALEANKKIYSVKIEALIDNKNPQLHEEWSKADAEEKRKKSEIESSARAKSVGVHKSTQEARDRKLKIAFDTKQRTIEQAEKDMRESTEKYLEQTRQLINEHLKEMTDKNDIANCEKEKAITKAHSDKKDAEEIAKGYKEYDDKLAIDKKKKEDEENKLKMDNLPRKYEQDMKQLENDFAKEEQQITIESQNQMKTIDETLKALKERSAKCESDIINQEKKMEEQFETLLKLAEKLKEGLNLSEVQETSIQCLHEAETALNNIEVIMRRASNFWTQIKNHCENMTRHILTRQVEMLEGKDAVTKQQIWNSESFKQAALQYSGQWQALKQICSTASGSIGMVQDEIDEYISENPTKEQAVEIVRKLASDLLGSNFNEKQMISNKPADN